MSRILIVEDDQLAAELERDYLEASGFEVRIMGDGVSGRQAALAGDYDLLILDVMLPGCDGFEICREVRKALNLPIIMVTAKGEDIDKIRGLGLGVDDYVTKPFSPSELVARVKAHMQIHKRLLQEAVPSGKDQKAGDEIQIGELRILIPYRRAIIRGKEAELKNREFDLLYFLMSNPGIVFTKDTLLDRVWGTDAYVETSTVTVHVNRLREKIEKDPSHPEYILTVWGKGYRFRDR